VADSAFGGQRVRLRAIEPEDWETFYAWNQDTAAMRGLNLAQFPQSKASAREWAANWATRPAERDNAFFVIENLDGEIVGSIDSKECDPRHGTFSYGLGVRREHYRKGYATEAVLLLLRHLFRERRYQKVTIHVYSFNEPSLRLHERLGFQQEGRLRRMFFVDGAWVDKVIFGMTAEEFEQQHAAWLASR
jgi:RimJ/RimL family protein N-acetyltransferase